MAEITLAHFHVKSFSFCIILNSTLYLKHLTFATRVYKVNKLFSGKWNVVPAEMV